jgi:hypothetical protein
VQEVVQGKEEEDEGKDYDFGTAFPGLVMSEVLSFLFDSEGGGEGERWRKLSWWCLNLCSREFSEVLASNLSECFFSFAGGTSRRREVVLVVLMVALLQGPDNPPECWSQP